MQSRSRSREFDCTVLGPGGSHAPLCCLCIVLCHSGRKLLPSRVATMQFLCTAVNTISSPTMHPLHERCLNGVRGTVYKCHVSRICVGIASGSPSRKAVACAASAVPVHDVDVAVVGSGIIGLCVAHKILSDTQLSVTLLDKKQPCAGATGAGK